MTSWSEEPPASSWSWFDDPEPWKKTMSRRVVVVIEAEVTTRHP